jgi:hypothetical protein
MPLHKIPRAMPDTETIQVSFRLRRELVTRMRSVATLQSWPPPPSQTEIVSRGIEMVLEKLEKPPRKGRGTG